MAPLNQKTVAKMLRRATCPEEVEAIVGAYAFCKQLRGYPPARVHRSIYLLSHYLNAVGLGPLVQRYEPEFGRISSLAVSSTPISHVVTPTTPLGLEAWNEARRRRPTGWFKRGTSSESIASAASSISEAGERGRAGVSLFGTESWWAMLNVKPPTYSGNASGYVDRDGEEGQRRVVQEDQRTQLPTYA
ncbi:hypothetical protein JCM8097_000343 [Rhodosporidiobolus ruineniae]